MKHLKNLFKLSVYCSFVFSLFSCTPGSVAREDAEIDPGKLEINIRKDIKLDDKTRAAVDILSDFNLKLLKDAIAYVDNNPNVINKNVVISPLSITMALGMQANCLDDMSAKELLDTLGVQDLTALNELQKSLLLKLQDVDNSTTFESSNAVFTDKQKKLNNSVVANLKDSYSSEFRTLDFQLNGGKSAAESINSWAADKTKGKINKIIESVDPQSAAVLINALIFKGIWSEKYFAKEDTKKKLFHGLSSNKEVDMMSSQTFTTASCFKIRRTDDYQLVQLSFGNKAFVLSLVLPKEGLTATDFNRSLTKNITDTLNIKKESQQALLLLPKFKLDIEPPLDGVLKEKTIPLLGKSSLKSTLILPSEFLKLKFIHKTYFEVNETGAEAAAVTALGYIEADSDSVPTPIKEVVFDRPFYFFITEVSTGACVLSGRIADL